MRIVIGVLENEEFDSIEATLEAVRQAILHKADEIVIKISYEKGNDFELKRGLMIHHFE